MRDPFAGYDQWLEQPYQDMIEESDAYYDWCETEGLDPETEEAEIGYQEYIESQYEGEYDPYDDDYDEEEADYYYDPLPE